MALSKGLMFLGLAFFAAGLLMALTPKGAWSWLGRLPGDVHAEGKHYRFYFPLATSLLLSLVLTVLLNLLSCARKPADPKKLRLLHDLESMQAIHVELEKKLNEPGVDPSLKVKISQERDLLKSRMDRVSENLKNMP